ncbi:uncharacterized protein LOC114273820 [Camellia sinensis]|uniref:uncharacterized protein LOC114273820 n=1 Tax=Camellia sinensis TaxID=4442 RepID=UPI00103562F5|nr:uncharacterized protein LOC114273820 [Camellia sinensis]
MVRRNEALYAYHDHQPPPTPTASVAPPSTMEKRNRWVPTRDRGEGKDAESQNQSRDSESLIQGAFSSVETTLTDEDTETRDTEEIASEHSESEDGDDDFGSESHPSGDSGANGDSDLESRPRKRTKIASRCT